MLFSQSMKFVVRPGTELNSHQEISESVINTWNALQSGFLNNLINVNYI